MYMANFAIAMWSSALTGRVENTVTQRRVRLIAWLTCVPTLMYESTTADLSDIAPR
jgi:hypothetical protein